MVNTWYKDADSSGAAEWCVRCDEEQSPGASVTVTARSGKAKRVTLGERRNRLGFVYAIVDTKAPPAAVGSLARILSMLERAAGHLRTPAIELGVELALADVDAFEQAYPTLPVITRDEGGRKRAFFVVRVSKAGERAAIPGSLTVLGAERTTTPSGEDKRPWLGRVTLDGMFSGGRETPPQVAPRLKAFAADPAAVAGEHARLVGRCCFCRLPISRGESTSVGYGPDCADHWGLPWGAKADPFQTSAKEEATS